MQKAMLETTPSAEHQQVYEVMKPRWQSLAAERQGMATQWQLWLDKRRAEPSGEQACLQPCLSTAALAQPGLLWCSPTLPVPSLF